MRPEQAAWLRGVISGLQTNRHLQVLWTCIINVKTLSSYGRRSSFITVTFISIPQCKSMKKDRNFWNRFEASIWPQRRADRHMYIFFSHKTLQKENSWARSIIFRHILNVAGLLFFVHNIAPVHSTVHIPVYAVRKEGNRYTFISVFCILFI
jgi:hypothetical protein